MMRKFKISGLDCLCAVNKSSCRITYLLYPTDSLGGWIEKASARYATTVVVVTGMDWQNDLTPWPAKGVPSASPDFEGNAASFQIALEALTAKVESLLGLTRVKSRALVGVSLSGLFTLWQWTNSNLFADIACLSGSFWYDGFVDWFVRQNLSDKSGQAYFLLGDKEPFSPVKEFDSVGTATQAVVDHLNSDGVNVHYDIVPGNHFQFPVRRLDLAMQSLGMFEKI